MNVLPHTGESWKVPDECFCCSFVECTELTVAVRVDGVEGVLVVDDQYVSIFYCSAGTLRRYEFIPLPHKIRSSCGHLRSFHAAEKYRQTGESICYLTHYVF